MHTTSVSLLQCLRQPDEARTAWPRFVELYTPLLYYWARRMGLQQSDASDLVQEVFAVLLQKLPGFVHDQGLSFRSWLRTVTLNKWRELQRRRGVPAQADDVGLAELAASDEDLGEVEYRQHVVGRWRAAMRPSSRPAPARPSLST